VGEAMPDGRERGTKRLFGRRKGHPLSPRQTRLMDDLLPRASYDPATWSAGPSAQPVWLEIGFGAGEHLIATAEANPGVTLIGCEPFINGVAKTLGEISDRGLQNIRLHPDDAHDVLDSISPGSIARAFILFPDPWPKRRHVKRRLINPPFLIKLAAAMAAGGELRIATDIGDYARTILLAFEDTPEFRWLARSAADWRRRPPNWTETRYERKAQKAGRRCYYLRFERLGSVDKD